MKRTLINHFSIGSTVASFLISSLSFSTSETTEFSHYHSALVDSPAAFIPNAIQGWDTLQSYLNQRADSIEFEVLLTRNVSEINDWKQPAFFGTIAAGFTPEAETIFQFKEPARTWIVRIYLDGKCSLQLETGPAPAGNPCIIPFKSKYRK